ncbi:MAG TPA: hypothetical protein VGG17_11580 [Acidimicrobiales bacterium]|jgi:hypothetical protein
MNRSKGLGVALATVLIGGGALALAGFALATASPHQAALQCVKSTTQAHACSFTISTFPDSEEGVHGKNGGPHPDWVTYSNDNIDVPAHTTVYVTIDQYDSGGAANNPYFDNVVGTRGGFDTVNGKQTTKVGADDIGHTFTLHGIPGNGKYLFISVPLPVNNATKTPLKIGDGEYAKPVVVKFSFTTGGATVYNWNCEFPCGGSREGNGFGEAMSSYGYMSGTITVE